MKEVTIQVPEGKKAEWINGVLTLVDEEVKNVVPVMERIKTFEDACEEIQANENDRRALLFNAYLQFTNNCIAAQQEESKDIIAYLKLRIIAAALNEGWEPEFTTEEYRYYPWFYLYTEEELAEKSDEWKKAHALWLFGGSSYAGSLCGLAYAHSDYAWTGSYSSFSARLAVKSEELAVYFGKQFVEIWADYVGPFNRK